MIRLMVVMRREKFLEALSKKSDRKFWREFLGTQRGAYARRWRANYFSNKSTPEACVPKLEHARDLRGNTRVVFQQSDVRAQGRTFAFLRHLREQKRCEIAAADPLTFGFS